MPTAELRFNISETQVLPFKLNDELTTLGMDPDNSIVIDNAAISSFHAEIRFDPSRKGYEIIDLDSRDGTRVNGKKIMRRHLESGDTIHFGQVAAELVIAPASHTANPKRLVPPKKREMLTASRRAMSTPGRLLVKSQPPGYQATVHVESATKVSAAPHKIKKAGALSDKTRLDKPVGETKLHIKMPVPGKSKKTAGKTVKVLKKREAWQKTAALQNKNQAQGRKC
ncbi:MAG: FHA domain-containing protein [Verrucomicrobiales bacterium]